MSSATTPQRMKPQRLLHLVARRGNSAEFPENTLPALQSAIDLGARFVELDVQLSADGVPMVIHDQDLVRTSGLTGSVLDMAAATLEQIDVHEPQRLGKRFLGTCIPRLTAALTAIEERREVTVFIGIGRASLVRFGHDRVVGTVLQSVRPFKSRCVIVSFDFPAVHRARASGGCQIGWKLSAFDNHTRLKYEALKPDFLFCDRELIPPNESLWRGPWRWVVHDVGEIESALALGDRGADFIGTCQVRAMSLAMRAHTISNSTMTMPAVATIW
jgi:glycerophosphoryl diester phosphodiesterase